MKQKNLDDAFKSQLRVLYGAEQNGKEALASMAEAATAPGLKAELGKASAENARHITRLDEVFRSLGETPKAESCDCFGGLMNNCKKAASNSADVHVRDANLIATAQSMRANEVAGYVHAHGCANALKHEAATRLLQTTLDEERASTKRLSSLAESVYPAAVGVAAM